MKKVIAAITLLSLFIAPVAANATAAPYKLPASYQAVYCYTNGSYWVGQRAAYPDYYAANDAYYRATYGPGTMYCPN